MDFSVQSTSESHYIDGIYNHLSVHVCVDAYDIDKNCFHVIIKLLMQGSLYYFLFIVFFSFIKLCKDIVHSTFQTLARISNTNECPEISK